MYSVLFRVSLFTPLLVTWHSSLIIQTMKKGPVVAPETSVTTFQSCLTAQDNERFVHIAAKACNQVFVHCQGTYVSSDVILTVHRR